MKFDLIVTFVSFAIVWITLDIHIRRIEQTNGLLDRLCDPECFILAITYDFSNDPLYVGFAVPPARLWSSFSSSMQ